MTDLLPPSSSTLERRVERACAPMANIVTPQRTLWSIDDCPAGLLPYLAWTFSVDRWDASWSEATKRAVIKSAAFVHQRKGTIGAIRRVVEPLGYLIKVIEWWQTDPVGKRGTFQLEVGVMDTGITDAIYQELERLIDDARRKSQHLIGLAITMETRGTLPVALTTYGGDILTVYAYMPEILTVGGIASGVGDAHIIDTMSIYP
ncbi:phage tail protein I [Silvimonas sp.]|uniref:phage tail protein I n=1 Tax=Silvimonas sp. TaxID=2650811 RepID=UPI00283BB644|nr:phage tail protein I [Silvimonas sp.]MDR3429687.1 phage tail protein I [Silvimonas sp.]